MSEECDPNQTTQFEVSKAGVKISSKRMSELVATLALVMLGVQSAFTWHLYRQVDALQIAIRAEFAETRSATLKAEAALRYFACVQSGIKGEQCERISGSRQ